MTRVFKKSPRVYRYPVVHHSKRTTIASTRSALASGLRRRLHNLYPLPGRPVCLLRCGKVVGGERFVSILVEDVELVLDGLPRATQVGRI